MRETELNATIPVPDSSNAQLRLIAETIPEVLFVIDAEKGVVAYISPALEDILGRSCASLLASRESWLELIHQEDRAAACDHFSTALEEGGRVGIGVRVVRPNGSIRWLEVRGYPIFDETGKIARITGIASDVTVSKVGSTDLRNRAHRLESIATSAIDAIVSVDEDHRIALVNPAAEQLFGYARDELIGQPLGLLLPSRFRAEHSTRVAAFGAEEMAGRKMGATRPVRGLRKNGEEFVIEASISRSELAGRFFYTAILRDVTERERAESKIRGLNRLYVVLSKINALIVRSSDRDELFREACRIAVDQGGYYLAFIGVMDGTGDKIVPVASVGTDRKLMDFVEDVMSRSSDRACPLCARAVSACAPAFSNDIEHDPEVDFSPRYMRSGVRSMASMPLIVAGEVFGVLVLCASEIGAFHEEELKLLAELAGDIAFAIDHIEKTEKINYLAYYDALTGLANRELFVERLQKRLLSWRNGQKKHAIIMFNIERFKSINDVFGRQNGDALLKQVSERAVRLFGGDATGIARVGGDRFVCIAPDFDSAVTIGDFIERSFAADARRPYRIGNSDLRIAFKAGVAIAPDDGVDGESLLLNAEAALKRAKATREHYLFFNEKMSERVAERLAMESRLHEAIENKRFVLHYQPKIEITTGRVVGAEALIRWKDLDNGYIPPMQFIPVLEETGLIHAVGRWALQEAVAQYLRWCDAGVSPVRIAVNVSPLQLRHAGFVAELEQAIGIDERAAAGLELEITEGLIMEDIGYNTRTLQVIRALGVTVAIDDFGTGFSSLSYLARLPIDTLKIDRTFVADMTCNPARLILVSAIISLASSLNLKVVAEGVENDDQLEILRKMNCDEIQGFLMGKPEPAESFVAKFL